MPLLQVERSCFAWEWLRRLPGYRAAALQNSAGLPRPALKVLPEQPAAARWGLHVFEDPALTAPEARPVWQADRHPFVLDAFAEPSHENSDAFALERLRYLATLVPGRGIERLLLSDGYRSIRLDLQGASLLSGPVTLRYELSGISRAKPAILALQRFTSLASTGQFARSLHPEDRRAKRLILLLRAYDAVIAGADQRTIAGLLLSDAAGEERWRVKSPSLRSRVQRLVHAARATAAGGFCELLR